MASSEKDIGRLEADMANLKARLDTHEARVDQRLGNIEGYLQEIRDAANMGKGMWWLFLKIGGSIVMVGMAISWVWEKASKFVMVRL